MKIKLFFFASLFYIVILGGFVFHLNPDSYTLSIASFSYTLPVVIWFLLPILILFIFAFFHMSFYAFLKYLKYKNFFSDANKFESFVQDLLLEKEVKFPFKTREFKLAAELTHALKTHQKLPNSTKINEILDLIDALKHQNNVNLKKFRLADDNILIKLNEKNHILNDVNYAYSKIKNKKEFEDDEDLIAFEQVLKMGNFEQINGLKIKKNTEQIIEIIKRFENKNLELNIENFQSLLSENDFDEKHYLMFAKIAYKKFEPDSILSLFKKIKDEQEQAFKAYLFLLAEFSMFDELRMEIGHKKGYEEFNIILLARERKFKVNLEDFIQ